MTNIWGWMSPYLWGIVAVLMFYVVGGLFSGAWNPVKFAEGSDGRTSTSKFQWLFWTAIALFSYVVIYAARARFGYNEGLAEIPTNVLYAMGFSSVTLTAAKGITVGYLNSKRLTKTDAGTLQDKGISRLLTDDEGHPDLTKIQMMAWTVLAGLLYLSQVIQLTDANLHRDADLLQMPDIDKSLMLLMGLGQATYLGKKLTSMDTPSGKKSAPGGITRGMTPSLGASVDGEIGQGIKSGA